VPRYFFNLYDDLTAMDEEGAELPSIDHARDRATLNARELACAEVMHGRLHLDHRIEVADEQGSVLLTVHFGDVVTVEPQG
jgi:hypothetical protein